MRKETKESIQSDTARHYIVTVCPDSRPIGSSRSKCTIELIWVLLRRFAIQITSSPNPFSLMRRGIHCK